ncbi:aldehyde dehydrogenase [Capsaspora owczarzaki ATCC 30864]|uniref:Aldehyde dehydrogenase n=1 Tax=Capsaspora owczarzaki (strain ATCC 30864) TaxID=595528 RepID=A0A0D2VKC6_CAPO3|nr:aldehyde dehydrogenase [Capsaspora owczarzaki ATCC 30864]KJE90467.1 aldehyde dehydrogenase [Capsaspora owczarzaki ATCC 30864]|eukprot:XP_004364645.1 aldehyde dehydrogenase [Capsaspora owczarzaki ATCC 30864]
MHSIQVVSPVDGSIVATRTLATAEEVDAVIERSKVAQKAWGKVPVKERVAICLKFVDAFVAGKDEIAKELTQQMGRPISQTPGEVNGMADRAKYMISTAEEGLKDVEFHDKPGFIRFIRKDAIGVILVVAAWNYPYLIAVNCVIPAILAGNSVVLKHSAQTPLCAERFADAFKAAGLPENVFQFVHMSHAHTERAILNPSVAFVNFTGSVAGGHEVANACGKRFIGCGLELGGKDPAYVRDDCNLDHAVENLVDGSFFNSGQCCCAIERIYVHEKVYDEFVKKFVELTKQYRLGNPNDANTNLGPMVKTGAADFVRKQIKDAVAAGAVSLIDESHFPASKAGTPYLAPHVLVNVNHSMSVMKDESFGPVIGIMKVSNDEEAIKLMNDSPFGLTAAIWTNDYDAAIRIGDQIETGTWFCNRCDYLDPALAWTGVKDSGRGCALSKLAWEHLTQYKSFHVRKL